MTDAWLAAFVLLVLLSVVNAVAVVAVLRQLGVIHQRIRPTGPGLGDGPTPGATYQGLELEHVAGPPASAAAEAPITIYAYVTPGCSLCDGLFEHVAAYVRQKASPLVTFALTTDAGREEAQAYASGRPLACPLMRHPRFGSHYTIPGSPYAIALRRDGSDGLMLTAGVVNTLEQFEDLVDGALAAHQTELPMTDQARSETQMVVHRLDPTDHEEVRHGARP